MKLIKKTSLISLIFSVVLSAPLFAVPASEARVEAIERRLSNLNGQLEAFQKLAEEPDASEKIGQQIEVLTQQVDELKEAKQIAIRFAEKMAQSRLKRRLNIAKSHRRTLQELSELLNDMGRHGGGAVFHYQGPSFEKDIDKVKTFAEGLAQLQASRSKIVGEEKWTSSEDILDIESVLKEEISLLETARKAIAALKDQRMQYLLGQDLLKEPLARLNEDRIMGAYKALEDQFAVAAFQETQERERLSRFN